MPTRDRRTWRRPHQRGYHEPSIIRRTPTRRSRNQAFGKLIFEPIFADGAHAQEGKYVRSFSKSAQIGLQRSPNPMSHFDFPVSDNSRRTEIQVAAGWARGRRLHRYSQRAVLIVNRLPPASPRPATAADPAASASRCSQRRQPGDAPGLPPGLHAPLTRPRSIPITAASALPCDCRIVPVDPLPAASREHRVQQLEIRP